MNTSRGAPLSTETLEAVALRSGVTHAGLTAARSNYHGPLYRSWLAQVTADARYRLWQEGCLELRTAPWVAPEPAAVTVDPYFLAVAR